MKKKIVSSINNGMEPLTKSNKIISWIAISALAIIAAGIGTFLYWSFQPEQVLEIKNEPFPVRSVNKVIIPGDVAILDVDFCKNYQVNGTVRISFVSATREILLPISNESSDKRCEHSEIPIIVPKEIPADTYRIKFQATYDLNPLKKNIDIEFESKPFVVVAQ